MPLLKRKRTDSTIEAAAVNSRNIQVDEASEENAYAARVEKAHGMDPRARVVFTLCIALVVLYFLGLLVPKDMLNQGLHNSGYNAGYSFSWFIDDLMGNMNGLIAVFTGNDVPSVNFTGTMLRFVVVAIAGAGLALCGAVYQGSFKNALVSPSTLGVTSGATLGMMAWVVFCVPDDGESIAWLSGTSAAEAGQQGAYLIDSYLLAVMSFIGCLLVVGIVLLVMRLANNGKMSGIMMIITGQVVGGVAGAVSNMVRYYYVAVNPYGTKAQLLTDLTISSFYRNFTLVDVVAVLVPVLVTFLAIMRLRNQMTLLQFSEAEARTMGVETRRVQVVTVALCTLLTAIIISFCGRVGFVGFLVPHLARRLVGPSFKYLLPAAAVLGAVFVLGAYLLVSCTLGPDFETMVGMFISIAGASVFLVTALRGKGGSRGQFQ